MFLQHFLQHFYNVVLVSAKQQVDSAIFVHKCLPLGISFQLMSPQSIE